MPPKSAIIKKKDAAPAKAKPAPAAKEPEAPEHQEEEKVATAEVQKDAPAYDGSTYPKRAMSSYMFWYCENASKLPKGFGYRKGSKGAGDAWRKLEDKSQWETKAREDKERFQEQLALFNEMHRGE